MSRVQPRPRCTLNTTRNIVPARGILPNKQLENPSEGLTRVGSAKREGTNSLCLYQTSASLSCARLGRVKQGSTAPEDQGCCSMQIGLFLFLLLIAITQSCACNKLP